jgi:hypothetical protein
MSRRLQGRLNITSAAFAACLGLAASKPAFGQQAVQWRIQDGGNGHWYIATTQAFPDFWTAHQVADSRGGHLVTITSEQENSFVAALAPGDFMLGGYQDLLAPNYAEPGGGWRWVTNEPWQFTAWNSLWVDEPNNGGSAGLDGEHYLQWWRFGDPWRSRWNDGGNDLSPSWWDRPAIFEWSADCNGDGIVDYGQILDGTFEDTNENGVPDPCDPCPGDVNDSGIVNGTDIAIILGAWGTSGGKFPRSDTDGNGIVDAADLAVVLGGWGNCP